MIYGYARVSTKGQDLQVQLDQLKARSCEQIFHEKWTGSTAQRPEFQKLMETLKKGDTLVVTKLDRFARSTVDALNNIKELHKRGVIVHVLDIGILDDGKTGELMVTMLSAFAQFERAMILERTREGKEKAKTRAGFTEGRPKKYTSEQLQTAMELLQQEGNSYTYVSKCTGISVSTLAREARKLKKGTK